MASALGNSLRLLLARQWLSLANMVLRAIGLVARFGLTFYLAKYLSLSDFGLFGLIVGAISVTPAIAGWGINYYLNRDVVGLPKLESGRMIRDRLAVTLASLLIPSLVVGPALIHWHMMPSGGIVLLTIALAVLESLAFDLYQVLINIGHPLAANVLLFIRSSAWVFPLAALGVWFPHFRTLDITLAGWLVGSLLSLIAMIWVLREWPLKAILMTKVDVTGTLEIMRKARLIYVSDLGLAITPYLDRYVVAHFIGLAASGVFTLYWSVANAPYVLVSTGVIQVSFPALVKEFRSGKGTVAKRSIGEMRMKTLLFSVVFCLMAGIGLPFLLVWLGKAELNQHQVVLWVLLLAVIVRLFADSFSMELACRHLDSPWALINIAGGLLTLVVSICCIVRYGLLGGAVSGLITQAILAAIRWGVLHYTPQTKFVLDGTEIAASFGPSDMVRRNE